MNSSMFKITKEAVAFSLFLVVLILSSNVSAESGTVRGKIETKFLSANPVPVPGIPVTLSSESSGRTEPVYTDHRGMYHIKNVPEGEYILEIWMDEKKPLKYKIEVKYDPSSPFYNIAPISVKGLIKSPNANAPING